MHNSFTEQCDKSFRVDVMHEEYGSKVQISYVTLVNPWEGKASRLRYRCVCHGQV